MKQTLLTLTLTIALGNLNLAQAQPAPVAATSSGEPASMRVLYSRALPEALCKKIPPNGKSRFFGVTSLKFKGADVLVHIYDAEPPKPKNPRDQTYYAPQYCVLDIFAQHKSRYKSRLEQINSIGFKYIRFVNIHYKSHETIGVNLTWLRPAQKQIPLINIDLRNHDGAVGPVGTNALVIFPDGLGVKAITQNFDYGADNSSDGNGWGWNFAGQDDKGFLIISSILSNRSEKKTMTWHWDGKKFTIVMQKSESWYAQ